MPGPAERLNEVITGFIDHIPEDMARSIVDGMPQARIAAGPTLAQRLRGSIPEERTWGSALKPAALSATDKIDGAWARHIGVTDTGRDLDREGDRSFVMPQQKALAENGEVPPVHYRLKVLRENAMAAMRDWAEHNDRDVSSGQVNKQKTAVEMATVTAAHSPLSRHPDVIRWGASLGTALSLTSLAETAFGYLKRPDSQPTDSARNSAAREATEGPRDRIATLLDERAPGVTPAHLTQWGKRLVEGAAVLAAAKPDRPAVATTMYTLGSLADTLDGALARKKGEDGVDGMIEDVQADLEQQIATFASLSIIARRRGNKVAAANYALATMLTPLSAYTRADAESHGVVVAEGGLGTRVGRGILGGVGMGLNRYRDVSDIVSATLAANTANTVLERRDAAKRGPESPHTVGVNPSLQFMQEAEVRKAAIAPYALTGLAVGSALLATQFRPAGRPQTAESPSDSLDTA